MSLFIKQHATAMTFPANGASWVILNPIEQKIKAKIEKVGVPLKDWDISINYGIKTGFNDAFIVNEETRNEILAKCATADERTRTAELIRPILRGRDIKRYGYQWANWYLIATHNGIPEKSVPKIDIEKYPAVKKHLDSYWQQIEKRTDQGDTPYHLRSCAYMDDFSKPKIMWGEISDKTKFALDAKGEFFAEATTFLMTGVNLPYLICYLNSSLSEYLFSKIGTTTGVGTVRWKKFKIEELFVPRFADIEEREWEDLLRRLSKKEITEADINRYIYGLCGLSSPEIEFVETYSASI